LNRRFDQSFATTLSTKFQVKFGHLEASLVATRRAGVDQDVALGVAELLAEYFVIGVI
jgi:hypothetical protein